MSSIHKYRTVLDESIHSCLDLTIAGYEYSGVREASTAALGTYLNAEFVHAVTRRKVVIDYFPEPVSPAREALCVHVTRDARDTHSGTFMVDDFLKHQRAGDVALQSLDLNAHVGSAAERVQRVLTEVATIFRSDLKDVVMGTEWVDVPIDWGDYK